MTQVMGHCLDGFCDKCPRVKKTPNTTLVCTHSCHDNNQEKK